MPATKTLPHTAVIYTDIRDRNNLLKSIIKPDDAAWNSAVILSSNPRADWAFFKGKAWKAACGRRPVSLTDMKEVVNGKPNPTNDIIHTIVESFIHESGELTPLVIGDWLHQVYDRFGLGLAVELHHTRSKTRNMICCYRGEGFWSLGVDQIAEALSLHQQVLFGKSNFMLAG